MSNINLDTGNKDMPEFRKQLREAKAELDNQKRKPLLTPRREYFGLYSFLIALTALIIALIRSCR